MRLFTLIYHRILLWINNYHEYHAWTRPKPLISRLGLQDQYLRDQVQGSADQVKTWSPTNKLDTRRVNGDVSFRWSFVPHFAWGSIESTTILTTHPSLQTHLCPLPDFTKSWLFQLQFPTRLSRVCLLSWFCPLSGFYPVSLSGENKAETELSGLSVSLSADICFQRYACPHFFVLRNSNYVKRLRLVVAQNSGKS